MLVRPHPAAFPGSEGPRQPSDAPHARPPTAQANVRRPPHLLPSGCRNLASCCNPVRRQVSIKSATGAIKLDTCRSKRPIWTKTRGRCPQKKRRMLILCTPVSGAGIPSAGSGEGPQRSRNAFSPFSGNKTGLQCSREPNLPGNGRHGAGPFQGPAPRLAVSAEPRNARRWCPKHNCSQDFSRLKFLVCFM